MSEDGSLTLTHPVPDGEEAGQAGRPRGPREELGGTRAIETPSPDDLDTGELPGDQGESTLAVPRVPTGATPTARLPRTVPPPLRPGYVAALSRSSRATADSERSTLDLAAARPRAWGRVAISSFFILVVSVVSLFFLGVATAAIGYVAIAANLPSPEDLQSRQTAFVSSKILDRDGRLLYEVMDPKGGRRTYIPLDKMSRHLVAATVAVEDRDFWLHPGFDPIAIARALYYNFSEGRIVSGASTITQQLARNVLLTPEERVQETAWRKIKEIVLAAELTRTYPKQTILEIYLNELYYGNLAYGIQAAAETYFGEGMNAGSLQLWQASFLAGLPQSPAIYDPYAGGLGEALSRQEDVLKLMEGAGVISRAEAVTAAATMRDYEFVAPHLEVVVAPHFVAYVRQTLEATYGPEALYRGSGLRTYTTLDTSMQRLAERSVREGVARLADRGATNGALVALEPHTGQILAMVGSADFDSQEIDGQVNVALRCRQPGSVIKPLTYVAAFERGWTPATLFWDVRTEFPDGANPPYVPINYDEEYHGPMLLREALANSYNVPAVSALQYVGIDGLLEISARLGVESLVHPEQHCPDYGYDYLPTYGLALTLGGAEARLLEITGAFAVFANRGLRVPPNPILRIEDGQGNALVDNSAPVADQVISSEHAFLITNILSDDRARCIEFRCPSVLELSRSAAVKTGTTNDFRDAWTIGYTPDLVTGVWVGNSDNSSMRDLPGASGAGPIWHDFMEGAHAGLPIRSFERPPGIVEQEICADSGALPTEHCERRKTELFSIDQPPLDESHDWYQMVRIDASSGLLATESCASRTVQELRVVIAEDWGRQWAQSHPERFAGVRLAPSEYCAGPGAQELVIITQPVAGGSVSGLVSVAGSVQLPDFDRYEAQYGLGDNPQGWGWISGPHRAQVREGVLTEWDTTHLAPGIYTLRLTAFDREQRIFEARVQVNVAVPASAQPSTQSPAPTVTAPPMLLPTPTSAAAPTAPADQPIAPAATDVSTPQPTVRSQPHVTATSVPETVPTPTWAPTQEPIPATPSVAAAAAR